MSLMSQGRPTMSQYFAVRQIQHECFRYVERQPYLKQDERHNADPSQQYVNENSFQYEAAVEEQEMQAIQNDAIMHQLSEQAEQQCLYDLPPGLALPLPEPCGTVPFRELSVSAAEAAPVIPAAQEDLAAETTPPESPATTHQQSGPYEQTERPPQKTTTDKFDRFDKPGEQQRKWQIYIGDLPADATESELERLFAECGRIINVHVQRSRSYAFVNFAQREGCIRAMRESGFSLRGQRLTIAGYHKDLMLVLCNLPDQVAIENIVQQLRAFVAARAQGLFFFPQVVQKARRLVYLHMLTQAESDLLFEMLEASAFSDYLEGAEQKSEPSFVLRQNIVCSRYQTREQRDNECENTRFHEIRSFEAATQGIYLSDMPFGTTEEEVAFFLREFGEVVSMTLFNSREEQGVPPCAVVFLGDEYAEESAIEAAGAYFDDQWVRITKYIKKGRKT